MTRPHARAAAIRLLSRVAALGLVLSWLCGLAIPAVASAGVRASESAIEPATERPPWRAARPRAEGPGRFVRELDRRRDLVRRHRGKDPAAVLALTGIVGELWGEIEDDELRAFIDGLAKDKTRHPIVRAYAGYMLARMDEQDGDIARARKRLTEEGWLLGWQIVGPFENASRAGEVATYEPETKPFAADASMFGKLSGEPLAWRAWDYDGLPRTGYVAFDDLLRPSEEAVGYATCWVNAPKDTDAAVLVGTGGPYKIWIDGVLVGEGDDYRLPDPLQDSHAARLHAGWNRVLVKVASLEGAWGFHLRLSAANGAPIAGLQQSAEPHPTKARTDAAPAHAIASLRGELERAADKDKSGAAGARLVELYRWVHPFDKDDKAAIELAREVDAKVKTPRSAMLVALLDPDPNGSRHALVDGVARARKGGVRTKPQLGQLLLELAWRERALGLESRFDELLDEAHAAAPDDPLIELALADRLAERGLPWAALEWTRVLAKRMPASQTLQHAQAARLRDLGRNRESLAVFEAMSKTHGSDRGVLGARIGLLLDLGRADEAALLAHRAADAMPGLPEAHAEVARLENARGDREAAIAALAQAVALAPHDADFHTELGRLLSRNGAREAAIASLRRSLELKPQQPAVRDLLASLDRKQSSDMLRRYAVDLREVGKTPTPAGWKGQQAGILHHRVAVKVLPNGLTERLDHRIIRILDDRGVRSQAVQALAFDPAESTVEVRRARVMRKDGTIDEIGEERMYALASAGYRMYYDQRQVQVGFPGLRPGDTIEVAFVRRDIAAKNMFDTYFGDIVPLSGMEPRKFVEYVLEAPADKPIYFNVKVQQKRGKDGRTIVYRHALKDVPGIKPEQGMPGWSEVAKYLHASTYKTWDDVGKWYWALVKEQLAADKAIKGAVKDVLGKLPPGADERTKVAAIYEHVVRNTRYVGLEFGIHGFKPYRTTDVYSRRFGDCKDKASLLKVMLAEAGIPSNLVLVRTRDQGTMPGNPASLAVFNHAITFVPSLDLYLDGTAEWSGPSELPSNDQGATVLLVKDGKGAELRTIPISKAGDNVRDSKQTVTLDDRGAAVVGQDLEVTGAAASALRYEFQNPQERNERLQKAFGELYPGITVEKLTTRDLSDIRRPAGLAAELRVPSWATDQGDGRQRFRVLGRPSRLVQSIAPNDVRKYDLLIDVPSVERHRIRYVLPKGRRFSQMPGKETISGEFGKFALDVRKTADGAEIDATIELAKHRVGKGDYAAFREFLRRIDAALEQQFTIEADR